MNNNINLRNIRRLMEKPQKIKRHLKSMSFIMNTMKTCGMLQSAASKAKINTSIIWPSTLKFTGVHPIPKSSIQVKHHSIDGTQTDISTCVTMLSISMLIVGMATILPSFLKVLIKTSLRSSHMLRSSQE